MHPWCRKLATFAVTNYLGAGLLSNTSSKGDLWICFWPMNITGPKLIRDFVLVRSAFRQPPGLFMLDVGIRILVLRCGGGVPFRRCMAQEALEDEENAFFLFAWLVFRGSMIFYAWLLLLLMCAFGLGFGELHTWNPRMLFQRWFKIVCRHRHWFDMWLVEAYDTPVMELLMYANVYLLSCRRLAFWKLWLNYVDVAVTVVSFMEVPW